jgi:hypothetical protein
MAYDLRRIAPERELPPFKPAWLVWTLLFALIVGGGAFGIIRFWPVGESTQTPWFWICVVAFPVIGWAVLFLSYLGALQAPRTRVEDHNTARSEYKNHVRRVAGVPLHILGSGFVFSTQEHENKVSAMVKRQLMLAPRSRYTGDSEALAARWIEPDGHTWRPGDEHADEERHREVLEYVFDSLLRQIAPALDALPERTRLVVQLSVAAQLAVSEIELAWRDTWVAHQLRKAVQTVISTTVPDLIAVDGWLDGMPPFVADAVNLHCVVQLNPLLNAVPAAGSAEVGVILMFASSSLATQRRLISQALLYRPEQQDHSGLGQGLLQVLLWSRSQAAELVDQWLTGGADASLQRELTAHLDAQDIGVLKTADLQGQHDIDLRIGSTGMAAPWLCVALACAQALVSGQKQLLSVAHAEHMTLAVVEPRF